ncbi:hypothetical protein Asulf_00952 [Archaeoglobus sulfaticallidus PM70-1]|uniref:Uncharacterized protein n=1 Tax=Archaeoglobus sulfaticallidus PM70-1 TaxID=387631 RepID=N0BKD1_9EURY|nr:hypothetical protein [Archaeoglobus sulfaticallidus]AGK60956.1 hypothetical protein Asulf_00952 [Archaeoglobus sulfaticallidus PM70-1]
MRARVDDGNDVKFWQLLKLSATRLGKKLDIQDLIFVDIEVASALLDLEHAIKKYCNEEEVKEFDALKRRIIRKIALKELKQTKEMTRLWIASSGGKDSGEDDD